MGGACGGKGGREGSNGVEERERCARVTQAERQQSSRAAARGALTAGRDTRSLRHTKSRSSGDRTGPGRAAARGAKITIIIIVIGEEGADQ